MSSQHAAEAKVPQTMVPFLQKIIAGGHADQFLAYGARQMHLYANSITTHSHSVMTAGHALSHAQIQQITTGAQILRHVVRAGSSDPKCNMNSWRAPLGHIVMTLNRLQKPDFPPQHTGKAIEKLATLAGHMITACPDLLNIDPRTTAKSAPLIGWEFPQQVLTYVAHSQQNGSVERVAQNVSRIIYDVANKRGAVAAQQGGMHKMKRQEGPHYRHVWTSTGITLEPR